MSRFSTGLRQALLDTGGFKETMDGGFIHIYGFGTATAVPTDPDAAIDTDDYTLLATISANGGEVGGSDGLNFAAPTNGTISKDSGQTWDNATVENFATGAPKFYLHVADAADNDGTDITLSATRPRILGEVGIGKPMQLQEATLIQDEVTAISFYNQTIGG